MSKQVVLVGPKKTRSSLLDAGSKAVEMLKSMGWKVIETYDTPEAPVAEGNKTIHLDAPRAPEDTPEALVVSGPSLQHANLSTLNAILLKETIEALVKAKLDSPEALLKISDEALVSKVGVKRTEVRKIRRHVHAPAEAEESDESLD